MLDKINSEIPLADDSTEYEFDPSFDLTYKYFLEYFSNQFQNALSIDPKLFSPITFRSKTFQKYIDAFVSGHADILSTRGNLLKELYILHQTSKSFYKYNDDVIHMSYIQFRSHFYYPNIIYLLVRFLPEARQFFQKMIKSAYLTIKKKNSRIIYLYETAIYTDTDVIKTDILYNFLGNAIKKINPFIVKNLNAFYRQVFLNHFFYYFKFEQEVHSQIIDMISYNDLSNESKFIPTRDNLYRDTLMSMQVENYKDESPTMRQLYYNFNIFKNVITNNEFQNIFLTSKLKDNDEICEVKNLQYKMLTFYNKIIESDEFLEQLKKIPLIFKLLKSVHLITKGPLIKLSTISADALKSAVLEELSYPFKNILHADSAIIPVLKKIANNFVISILSGEYITLQTLNPINLDQMSFITQLRKFIKLCLSIKEKNFIFSNSLKLGLK